MNSRIYTLRNDVAMEKFDNSALLFQAADCRLFEINTSTYDILARLDGIKDVQTVAEEISKAYGEPVDEVLADTSSILNQLVNERFLKQRCILPLTYGSEIMSDEEIYMVNPDVSCRIEDEDGAILYNPDTDAVQVINPMGLEIWETLAEPQTLASLVAHINEVCEDAPVDSVETDIKDFVEPMLEKGFIGVVEE
jgi:hypothetical protein